MKSAYVSATQTTALLAQSASFIEARLTAADMVTAAQAAAHAGVGLTTMAHWIADGRALAFERGRKSYRLPRWQFEPLIWNAIPHVAGALHTKHNWALLSFLESPCGALGGRTPRQALQQGELRQVLRAGLAESH